MVSVIVYGRNDTHGYNLHKRAAISLNCIAEQLSHPDDEIIFVDYNTPNDLPTFAEAIYDTLTPRAKQQLRVLRLRPHVHRRLYGGRTHLEALEPISRNIAIRRSNPRNRWILATNTDMIFVPREGTRDLTSAVADLADGHYALPRFDLPESLWEGWPRMDPEAVIRACDQLGKALHLHEITATYPYMRFDSPGDFQLIPRETLFRVFGFDERMIHGWHVDSNMSRRLWHLFGRTESLAARLKGYHCDHTRVTTLVHRLDLKLDNDVGQFVFECDDPYASHQATSWGLPEEEVEEIDFVRGPSASYASVLQAALRQDQEADYLGDANDTRSYISYHSEHVLPYVVGYLTSYPPSTRYLYVGANTRMLDLLDTCLSRMSSAGALQCVAETLGEEMRAVREGRGIRRAPGSTDEAFGRSLVTTHDLLVFDFGLEATALPRAATRVTDWPRADRHRLGAVARLFESCAEQCHEVFASDPASAPDFVVVNSNPAVFAELVSQFLLTTQTPYNIQVRKGRARLGTDRLYRSHRWVVTEGVLHSLFGYGIREEKAPRLGPGQSIDLTTFGGGNRYTDGHWGAAEARGTWTDGRRAELVVSFDPAHTTDLIAEVLITHVAKRPGKAPVRVDVLFERERLAHWVVDAHGGVHTFRVPLPSRLVVGRGECVLAFEIAHEPRSAPAEDAEKGDEPSGDSQELGVMIHSVAFHDTQRAGYRIDTAADVTSSGQGAFYMNSGWTVPDKYGAWTLGPRAELTMYLETVPTDPLVATVTISDAAVGDGFPHLDVDVLFNGQPVDRWRLGPSRTTDERRVVVTAESLIRQRPLHISFVVQRPRSPEELGWSEDQRPLGFRLTQLRMTPLPKYHWGEVIDFTEGGNAGQFLGSGWATPDDSGRWTEGEEATLRLRVERSGTARQFASFLVWDSVVDPRLSPTLPVHVHVNGALAEEWVFGPDRSPHVRTIALEPERVGEAEELVITFRVREPRSPASLGWSADPRPLGIRIARARLGGDPAHSMVWAIPRQAARSYSRSIAMRARRLASGRLRPLRDAMRSGFAGRWSKRRS